ncbi:glycosyltransferase family 4 protein [Flavisolibacter sp. BT320]|nr:glycosyltransferase family 4 protein [Flavisolibacter longurius]
MVSRLPRLAILTTHPIQYNAPLFALLAQRRKVDIKVFYTWGQSEMAIYDPAFGHTRVWDIPILEGYAHCFVTNTAKNPGSHHFNGINNPELVTQIQAWQPQAILIFGWAFQSHLACMRVFKGKIPVFFRGDSTLLDETPSLKTVGRRLFLRWVYRHIDLAFYVGEHNKTYFKKHGLSTARLAYAPHAVDNNRFAQLGQTEEAETARWRTRLGLKQTDWVVLFVGKLEEKKNPAFILQLAERLKDPGIKFLLVGNGRLEKDLKAQATDSRVIFLDFQNQSQMPLVYRLGQVLVLPSKGPGETWGLAANEAMACGLPVILSEKVGSAPDLVGDKETGLVFSTGDVDSVASYICKLQKDGTFYERTSENARQHIRSFCFEKVAEAIEEQMQEIAAK